jgi:hypothetical protein
MPHLFRLVALLLLAGVASAQPQKEPPDLPLTDSEKTSIIQATADRIDAMYFDPVKGKEIAATLRAALRNGDFASIPSALQLVPAVNRVLRAAGDAHLRFGYSHEPSTKPDDAPDTPEERARWLQEVARNGYGIQGVQRLDGNVGLLTWTKFHEPELAGATVAHAMALLQSTDALIIDLRSSDGGSPEMVALLLTYFMPEGDPVHFSTVYNRPKNSTRQYWTQAYVPGSRYVGKPVYILTSKRTFSAAEGFTEHMRRLRHATIVGEMTRGGSHMSRWVTVHPNFAISIPVARHVEPARDWEGVGITPDVATTEAEALRSAHLLALQALR